MVTITKSGHVTFNVSGGAGFIAEVHINGEVFLLTEATPGNYTIRKSGGDIGICTAEIPVFFLLDPSTLLYSTVNGTSLTVTDDPYTGTPGNVQPNVIIEGRGKGILAKILDWGTYKSSKSTQRYEVDQRKSNSKLIKTSSSTNFYLVVENNDPEHYDDFRVSAVETKRPSAWTIVYRLNGAAQTLPATLRVSPRSRSIIEVEITAPATTIPGELMSTVVVVQSISQNSPSYDLMDSARCAAVLPIVSYDDIRKAAEHLLDDEALFPVYSSFTSQQVCEGFIDEETSMVIKDIMDRMDGIQIEDYDMIRAYLVQRVLYREITRAVQLTTDGGSYFEPSLRLIAGEADRLWTSIQYGR